MTKRISNQVFHKRRTPLNIKFTALTALILLFSGCAIADTNSQEEPPQVVVRADNEEYNLENQQFIAEGNAVVTYKDVTLKADTITGNSWTGDIEAHGNVSFLRKESTLTGESFTYNFKTEKGLANDASATLNNIQYRGKEFKSELNRYTVTGSRFTTCDREKPHYYMSARELIIEPDKKLTARDVSIVFFGKRILNVPKYTINLDKKNPSETKLPPIGISGHYGIFTSYEFDISHEPRTVGALELRLSTEYTFQGGLMYDRIAGRPIFLRATSYQPFYGGTRSGLTISKLPEVGARFHSGEAAESFENPRNSINLSAGTINPLRFKRDNRKMNYVSEVGFGKFTQYPDDKTSERMDARAIAWLDPVAIDSKTVISPGIGIRLSHYSTGDDYTDLGLSLALARRLGSDSYASITYATHSVSGSTPFEFDAVELTDELHGLLRLHAGDYAIELGGRYDLNNKEFFDKEISIARRFHCIEPKITFKNRFKEFSIGIGLVGF